MPCTACLEAAYATMFKPPCMALRLVMLMILPFAFGFDAGSGFARLSNMCLPASRVMVKTVLRLTWRTSSQSSSGKFSTG